MLALSELLRTPSGVADDPGFYADWHFVAHLDVKGDGICPAPGVYTDAHGTIHDDDHEGVDCTANAQSWGGSSQVPTRSTARRSQQGVASR